MPRRFWISHMLTKLPRTRLFCKERLLPARAISQGNIPCVVWGDDGLLWGHDANTGLWKTLEVIVPDSSVNQAAELAIASSKLPDLKTSGESWREGEEKLVELVRRPVEEDEMYRDEMKLGPEKGYGYAYPDSVYLKRNNPDKSMLGDWGLNVLIHPASSLDFPINDPQKTMTLTSPYCASSFLGLEESWSNIRFPTLPTFIDTLTAMILTPLDGINHTDRRFTLKKFLNVLLARRVFDTKKGFGLRTGSRMMRYREVLEHIDPANRPFIERMCLQLPPDDEDSRTRRLDIIGRRDR